MTRIRPALPSDAAAVTACVRAAYAGYVERIGREPAPMGADYAALIAAGAVWVAHEAGCVVGVLVLQTRGPALVVENVAVLPERQGRGLGRELIGFAEGHARRAGLAAVTLYTNAHMTENLRFYPALGYIETGRGIQDGSPASSTASPCGDPTHPLGVANNVVRARSATITAAAVSDTPPLPRPNR